MYEEICLTCSRQLPDDSRAYCSDECEALDVHISPSISSASSALSSPHIDHAPIGGEVPALLPSALGSALNNFRKRDRYSTSSSSSSVSWSVFTDAEDDEPVVGIDDDSGCEVDCVDASIDPSIRSITSHHHAAKPSSLIYTRRPSATNHHSMIPLLHRRTSSSSSLSHIPSPTDDEPELAHEALHHSRRELPILSCESEKDKSTVTSKTKKSRNRASLPAYFSLLQISSPQRLHPLPPSGNTVDHNPRPSPPTPKLASLLTASGLRSTLESTPRGRRREPEPEPEPYPDSRSHSRSRTRQSAVVPESRGRQDSRGSVEQLFDWSCAPLPRGRPTARRNSSPLPKTMLCMQEFEDPALVAPAAHERRGRYRTYELEGRGSSRDAPGYGNGRSGLRERERTAGRW